MNSVAVLGAGAWGTALAIQAARAGGAATLWARDPARARAIDASRQNPRLPGTVLPRSVTVTDAFPGMAKVFLLAVPVQQVRVVAARLPDACSVACCAKGIETGTLRLPLEILAELRPNARTAILTGPNFAAEIAAGKPAATVAAAIDTAFRAELAALLGTPAFRIYGNDDPIGAQLGGAAKNVIAIAAGAVIGAGLGENARAGLITRGLAEMARVAVAWGGRAETVMGLSGLGDLLLSCTSPTSRNYSLGLAFGRGETLASLLARSHTVIEGVPTAPALVARAAGLDVPICTAVADWLAGRTTLALAMTALLARPQRDE